MSELLIGCGSRRAKLLGRDNDHEWHGLVTLDNNPDHKPDIMWDLNKLPLPFNANSFNEVHAYEVLEHLGQQGDAVSFFAIFSEIWRLLTPGGVLYATCPLWNSMWAWSDPSHRRIISYGSLIFLSQQEYIDQVGKSPMSDFRHIYHADFDLVWSNEDEKIGQFAFALKAIKPSRRRE